MPSNKHSAVHAEARSNTPSGAWADVRKSRSTDKAEQQALSRDDVRKSRSTDKAA